MASKQSDRSKRNAAYLREHKVTRTSGMCPWGCGRPITNGGDTLIHHLARCHGKAGKRYAGKAMR